VLANSLALTKSPVVSSSWQVRVVTTERVEFGELLLAFYIRDLNENIMIELLLCFIVFTILGIMLLEYRS